MVKDALNVEIEVEGLVPVLKLLDNEDTTVASVDTLADTLIGPWLGADELKDIDVDICNDAVDRSSRVDDEYTGVELITTVALGCGEVESCMGETEAVIAVGSNDTDLLLAEYGLVKNEKLVVLDSVVESAEVDDPTSWLGLVDPYD